MNRKGFLSAGSAFALAVILTSGTAWAGETTPGPHMSVPNRSETPRLMREYNYSNGETGSYYFYAYNEAGLLSFKDYYSDDLLSSYTFYEYDDAGQLIREGEVDAEDGTTNFIYTYEYDANGNQIKRTTVPEDGGAVQNWAEFSYDENGNNITQAGYSSGKLFYSYQRTFDEAGNMLLQERYDSDGELELREEFSYDDAGHLIAYTSSGPRGSNSTINYEWSADFLTRTSSWYYSDGSVGGDTILTFDEAGNTIKSTTTYINDGSVYETEYVYE